MILVDILHLIKFICFNLIKLRNMSPCELFINYFISSKFMSVNDDTKKSGISEFLKSGDDFIKKIYSGFENAMKDAGTRTIETKYGNTTFKTEIGSELDIDVTNSFPDNPPEKDNEYWVYHKELVSKIIDVRKELLLKIIDTTGVAIRGIVNPASVVSTE